MKSLNEVSKRIDRAAIRLYADISDDHNPIHIDPVFAAASPMKGIVAHGMLSLNLVWQSLRASKDSLGAGTALDVRFLKPVCEDDVITAGGTIAQDGTCEVWVRNQRNEIVIAGTATL